MPHHETEAHGQAKPKRIGVLDKEHEHHRNREEEYDAQDLSEQPPFHRGIDPTFSVRLLNPM